MSVKINASLATHGNEEMQRHMYLESLQKSSGVAVLWVFIAMWFFLPFIGLAYIDGKAVLRGLKWWLVLGLVLPGVLSIVSSVSATTEVSTGLAIFWFISFGLASTIAQFVIAFKATTEYNDRRKQEFGVMNFASASDAVPAA